MTKQSRKQRVKGKVKGNSKKAAPHVPSTPHETRFDQLLDDAVFGVKKK